MKTHILLSIYLLIMLMSSCMTVGAVNDPVMMGIIDYRDYEYIVFTGDHEVNLSFVSSEAFTQLSLLDEKIAYYPSVNETKYKFTSLEVSPESWFIPGVKDFIYQDVISGQLYIISVDYTDVDVPLSNLEVLYNNLVIQYDNLFDDYSELLIDLNEAQYKIESVNDTLSDYIKLVNKSLVESVELLYEEFLLTKGNLNVTKEQLVDTLTSLKSIYDNLNKSKDDYKILIGNYSLLLIDFDNLNESYGRIYGLWFNDSGELSRYENFVDNLNSGKDSFHFDGKTYYSIKYYDNEIKKSSDEVGFIPIYIGLTVIIVFIVFFVFYRWKIGSIPLSPIDMDAKMNYPREASLLDKFSLGRLFGHKDIRNPNESHDIGPTNPIEEEQKETESTETKYNKLKKEIDTKIEALDTKIDTRIKGIEVGVDLLLEAQGIKK